MSSEHRDRAMRMINVNGIIGGALLRLVAEEKLKTKLSDQVCPLCSVKAKSIIFGNVDEDKPYFSFCEACCGVIPMNPAWIEGVVKKGLKIFEGLQPVLDQVEEKVTPILEHGGKVLAFGLGACPVPRAQRMPRMPKPSMN